MTTMLRVGSQSRLLTLVVSSYVKNTGKYDPGGFHRIGVCVSSWVIISRLWIIILISSLFILM